MIIFLTAVPSKTLFMHMFARHCYYCKTLIFLHASNFHEFRK